jgi:hypothetical protein
MLIGVISDTHDDMVQIRRAVEVLNKRDVSLVLHAGDYCAPFVFEFLRDLRAPLKGIFGNNDGDRLLLQEKSGGALQVQPLVMELQGRRLVLMHEPPLLQALATSGLFDVLIYGHLHEPEVRQAGRALILNPGKVARLHKGESTLAVLDLQSLQAELIKL